VRACGCVYHIELRQFPHNMCRFNLTEQDLRAVLAPWVLEKPVELGERKWSSQQAKLTVLEGPHLELQSLSMGRGWRAAQRRSEDVTARVIAAMTQTLKAEPAVAAARAPGPSDSPASPVDDPLALGVQLASLLGDDPARLLAAWREASAEEPSVSPSEALARAEVSLRTARPRSR
jgi:hypothetical protein